MSHSMSVETGKALGKNIKKGTSSQPTKSLKRDIGLASPTSPDASFSLSNLRMMFQEVMEPVNHELDAMKTTLQANSEQEESARERALCQLTECF